MAENDNENEVFRNSNDTTPRFRTITTPNPDPTERTKQDLIREIDSVRERVSHDDAFIREVLQIQIEGNLAQIKARLDGNDAAVTLLRTMTDKVPQQINDVAAKLQALHDEKFRSIEEQSRIKFEGVQIQFSERDKRTEQLSLADKTAIAAALQAQKEAAGATNESNSVALLKMETNFAKLIDQGQTLLQSVVRNTDEKINDLKSRLDRGEGKTSVSDPAVANGISQLTGMISDLGKSRDRAAGHAGGTQLMFTSFVSVIVAAVSVVGLVLTLTLHSGSGSGPAATAGSEASIMQRLIEQNASAIQRLDQQFHAKP